MTWRASIRKSRTQGFWWIRFRDGGYLGHFPTFADALAALQEMWI